MRMRSKLFSSLIFAMIAACQSGPVDDPIPLANFSPLVLNLSFPENAALFLDGGSRTINSIGVRGVIVYRVSSSRYLAFERNCSYRPNEACATVNVHSSGLYMTDPCCNSNFNFSDGSPGGGPAWRPLRQYRTELDGSLLTITDEALN